MSWGAAIAAGAQLIGGRRDNMEAEEARFVEANRQREFAQNSIIWRVQDAKQAGVHPLFALGASGASYTPSAIQVPSSGIAEAGQTIGRAMMAQKTDMERDIESAQLDAARAAAARDFAHASYYDSLAARERQGVNPPLPLPGLSSPGVIEGQSSGIDVVGEIPRVQTTSEDIPGRYNVVKGKDAEVTSANEAIPYVTAGPADPGSKRYRLSKNMEVLLPAGSSMSESLESLSESYGLLYFYYKLNIAHYGEKFTDLAFQELGLPTGPLKLFRKMDEGFDKAGRVFSKDFWRGGLGRFDVQGVPQSRGGAAFGRFPNSGRRRSYER